MNPSLVLPEDFTIASTLNECCLSCLNRARMELTRDNIDEAERWVKEFQRCKKDLDKLIEKKKQYDSIEQLVNVLQSKGVNVAIIKKLTAGNSEHKSNSNLYSL